MGRWIVAAEQSGCKLLVFLKEALGNTFSLRSIKRGVESSHCKVNGRVERFASYIVGAGDTITFEIPADKVSSLFSQDRILYEDENLLFYDKSCGVVCIEEGILHGLAPYVKGPLFLVHRLDKETSGVIVIAKNKPVQTYLLQMFKERKVDKRYLAIVHGEPSVESGVLDKPLLKRASYRGQAFWAVGTKGLAAITEWRLLSKKEGFSLLECHPITGRTHQIRVHLKDFGFPILGDSHYFPASGAGHTRMYLHAWQLGIVHPVTSKLLTVQSPPADFHLFKDVVASLI